MNNFFSYYDKFVHEMIYSYVEPKTKLSFGLTNKFQFDIYNNFQFRPNKACMESQMLKFVDMVKYATDDNINLIKQIVKYFIKNYGDKENNIIIDFLINSLGKKRFNYKMFTKRFVSNLSLMHPKIADIFDNLILSEINKLVDEKGLINIRKDAKRMETLFKYFMIGGSDNINIFEIFEKNNIFVEEELDNNSYFYQFNIWNCIGRSSQSTILKKLIGMNITNPTKLYKVVGSYNFEIGTIDMCKLLNNSIHRLVIGTNVFNKIIKNRNSDAFYYLTKGIKPEDGDLGYFGMDNLDADDLIFMTKIGLPILTINHGEDIYNIIMKCWHRKNGIDIVKFLLENYDDKIDYNYFGFVKPLCYEWTKEEFMFGTTPYNEKYENFLFQLFDLLLKKKDFISSMHNTAYGAITNNITYFIHNEYFKFANFLLNNFDISISNDMCLAMINIGNIELIDTIVNKYKINIFNKPCFYKPLLNCDINTIKYFEKELSPIINNQYIFSNVINKAEPNVRHKLINYFLTSKN